MTVGLALACIALMLTKSWVLVIGGPVLGLTMLWSLLPRPDKFTPPGPAPRREDAPRLFAELDRVAAQLGEKMPADVYLLQDLNAWVADREAWVRRVTAMGIAACPLGAASQIASA